MANKKRKPNDTQAAPHDFWREKLTVAPPPRSLIERIAGTGACGAGAPGNDPLTTPLSQPHALWLDLDETLYISDSLNHRILILRN